MFFTEEKIHKRVNELEPYRYRQRQPISGWQTLIDKGGKEKYPPENGDWQPVTVGQEWHDLDHYYWLKSKVTIPDKENVLLLFDLGLPGNLNQTGFEGLLFIDGKPYQGIDSNHQEVLLTNEQCGRTIKIAIKLWTGMYGRHGNRKNGLTHKFRYADIAILDKPTDDLYFTARNMISTVDILDKDSSNHIEMVKQLDRAIQILDWEVPGSDDFYESCKKADKTLDDYLKGVNKTTPVTVTALGHTHIDLAWLWRLKHTREKAARSFSTVLRLMDQYPEYIFMQSTPQIYEFIKEDYPEIYSQIKKRIAEGRWEIDGGMWLEADCNIPSGESLVRQLLFGSRFMKKEFGKKPHYLWLPDVFGYSWALPQILKKSGLDTFMTTKISWNEYNRMPHDTFMWKGIDGTEILTHFITTPDPGKMKENPDSWFYTYNGLMTPSSVKGIYDAYSDKNLNNSLLLAYGYGDGGGGVNRDMLESRRKIDEIPGLPHVKPATARKYFDDLHQTIAKTDQYVPTWDGELYLEFHRGTYTSQAYMKRTNRKLELLYRELEFASMFGILNGITSNYPQKQLNDGWTIILRNQFHDIIPGSAIHEVYEDSKEDYGHALDISKKIQEQSNNNFSEKQKHVYTVMNSAGWNRDDIVFIGEEENGYFEIGKDTTLVSTKLENGYQVYVPKVPALGTKTINFISSESENQLPLTSVVGVNSLDTKFYKLLWNKNGQITSLFDKQAEREVFAKKSLNNTLEIYEDKPRDYDAWNIDFYYYQKKKIINTNYIKVVTNDELKTIVEFHYVYQQSTIKQQMILYSNDRRIDFKTEVDWKERQKLLKAGFLPDVRNTEARYQIQFGNLKRTTTWNTSWDWAKFETVGHEWADLSEHDYGLALMNDSKYGYSIKDNRMSLTLLKGAISPDPQADVGLHKFTYSILPHTGDFVKGGVEQSAWALNNPLVVQNGVQKGDAKSIFAIPEDQVIAVDAVKKAEDSNDLIIRFHDHTGGRRKIALKPLFECEGWREVNLMEDPDDENWSKDGTILLTLDPYEIKTLEFKRV